MIESLANYGYGYMWGNIVECLSGKSFDFIDLAFLHAKSNLAKYLPGNVMHFVSRAILAKNYDISLQTTAWGSLLDVLVSSSAAFFFVVVALRGDIFGFLGFAKKWIAFAALVFFAALLVGLCALKKMNLCCMSPTSTTQRRFRINFFKIILENVVLYLLYYLLMS
ncbi:MAG: hypothetical protein LBP21_04490, partial [Synergistaceae bacterium]|nr:hypothetical protein [Synergistaceae bacterium]